MSIMEKKEIIVRRYDPERLKRGIALWAFIVGLFAVTLFVLISRQTIAPYFPPAIYEKIISPWDYLIFIIVAVAVTIILAKTDMFGGLSDSDRELLKFLYLNEKKEFNRYHLHSILKKQGLFKKVYKRQFYRIVEKFQSFGYIYLKEGKYIYLTKQGKSLIAYENKK